MEVVRCHWLSYRESHVLCCGLGGESGGRLSISSVLSHSTSVVSRTSGWTERHSIHGYSILQMTLLQRREGGKKRTSAGEKKADPQSERDWKGKRNTEGVRVGNERNWVNTAACLRTSAAVLNLGLSGQPSAKRWVRGAREQKRKRSDLKSWSHHSGQARMGTLRASPSADQTSHRKSAFGSPVWVCLFRGVRKTGKKKKKKRESSCRLWKVKPHTGTPTTENSQAAFLFPSPPRSSLAPACSWCMSSLRALPLLGSWTHSWSMPREGTWNVWPSS